jgi:uncharacterized protein (TIGR02246 family)
MTTKHAATTDAKQTNEQAIRELVDRWLAASKQGDFATLRELLADDVLFITPGREPFGKEAFAGSYSPNNDMKMEADIDIKEIEVIGEWAWMRSFLKVAFTRPGEDPVRHSGHILTILQKGPDGKWVIKRDANFVAPETGG